MIAQPNAKIILCIPGPWRDRDTFCQAIGERARYLAVGPMLLDLVTQERFGLTFEGFDKRMAEAFRAAAPAMPTALLSTIARHRSVLYLTSENRSLAGAQALMQAAAHVLESDGLAVKVETTGLAHSAQDWHSYSTDRSPAGAHQALVVFVQGRTSYSCGMHNFGLKDAQVSDVDSTVAINTLRHFSWYLLSETPSLEVGQSFASALDGPVFRIENAANSQIAPEDLFYNAFGVWRLQQIAQ
jgi:hypothetical protein